MFVNDFCRMYGGFGGAIFGGVWVIFVLCAGDIWMLFGGVFAIFLVVCRRSWGCFWVLF